MTGFNLNKLTIFCKNLLGVSQRVSWASIVSCFHAVGTLQPPRIQHCPFKERGFCDAVGSLLITKVYRFNPAHGFGTFTATQAFSLSRHHSALSADTPRLTKMYASPEKKSLWKCGKKYKSVHSRLWFPWSNHKVLANHLEIDCYL